MRNYYEILEVNPKASREVIEKAYRVLIRKYHPDLYSGEKKQYAEKKTSEINEAYHVLTDKFLKEQYDNELEKQEIKYRQNMYQAQKTQAERRSYENQTEPREEKTIKQKTTKTQKVGSLGAIIELTKELIHDLTRNKDKRKRVKEVTKTDILAVILTIVVVVLIGVILWFIPFTNGWMREFLFENPLSNWIGQIFS